MITEIVESLILAATHQMLDRHHRNRALHPSREMYSTGLRFLFSIPPSEWN